MSERATRAWIYGLSVVTMGLSATAAVVWLVQGLCESVEPAQRDIVRCDHERGRAWYVLSLVTAFAPAAGHQSGQASATFSSGVRILRARR